jgi:hypothetical protein
MKNKTYFQLSYLKMYMCPHNCYFAGQISGADLLCAFNGEWGSLFDMFPKSHMPYAPYFQFLYIFCAY